MSTYLELKELSVLSRVVNVLGAASDIAITTSLAFYLYTLKPGFKATDAIMNQLILFSVSTGVLTTVCALSSLITISVLPDTFVYIAFYSTLARFYATSFFATLNARNRLRDANKSGSGSRFVASILPTFQSPVMEAIQVATLESPGMEAIQVTCVRITPDAYFANAPQPDPVSGTSNAKETSS
ncbi:hypothetical protein MPER_01787 [Moniliophthora perniciosa FA553]|nr:hypothetical protein MPER_01787 [Moniliophthora perniciosa FA553]